MAGITMSSLSVTSAQNSQKARPKNYEKAARGKKKQLNIALMHVFRNRHS
jgi:hypothetical protein